MTSIREKLGSSRTLKSRVSSGKTPVRSEGAEPCPPSENSPCISIKPLKTSVQFSGNLGLKSPLRSLKSPLKSPRNLQENDQNSKDKLAGPNPAPTSIISKIAPSPKLCST